MDNFHCEHVKSFNYLETFKIEKNEKLRNEMDWFFHCCFQSAMSLLKEMISQSKIEER